MNTAKLDRYIDNIPLCGIPGCDFALARDGKIVYRRSTGFSNHEKTKAVSPDDIYRVFSVSKVTTCVCAMRLVEAGLLKLDDPVSKYIPSFANLTVKSKDGSIAPAQNTMTIEHLFTMTGGLDYNCKAECITRAATKEGANTLSMISALAEQPLHFEPGTSYQYSLCHDVLAAVVEVVTGMPFSEYVRKNITEPLGMENTGFRPTEEQHARFAEGFRFVHGLMCSHPTDIDEKYNSFILCDNYDSGGAGLFSTVDDQMKMLSVLACGGTAPDGYRLLSPETIALMGENRLPDTVLPTYHPTRLYGYGWGLCGRAHMNKIVSGSRSGIGEFGWDGAAGAFVLVDPANRVSMYFGMEVLGCQYSYHKIFPDLRDMAYELLGIE